MNVRQLAHDGRLSQTCDCLIACLQVIIANGLETGGELGIAQSSVHSLLQRIRCWYRCLPLKQDVAGSIPASATYVFCTWLSSSAWIHVYSADALLDAGDYMDLALI